MAHIRPAPPPPSGLTLIGTLQRLDQIQVHFPFRKPSAICSTGEDLLLCSDDESKANFPIILNFYGITIYGTATELLQYPAKVTRVSSMAVLGQLAYSAETSSSSSQATLFRFKLEAGEVARGKSRGSKLLMLQESLCLGALSFFLIEKLGR